MNQTPHNQYFMYDNKHNTYRSTLITNCSLSKTQARIRILIALPGKGKQWTTREDTV